MPKLLTVRKQKWASVFKPKKLKGLPLNPSAAATERYYAALRALIVKMTSIAKKEIERFYKQDHATEYFAEDASIASQARILANAMQKRFDELFGVSAKDLAESMVEDMDKSSAVALRLSLKQLSGGLTLKTDILTGELNEILTATVTENIGLIKSIPKQYLDGVRGQMMRSITTGQGLAELIPAIQKQGNVTLKRARLIATDQTLKAFGNLNKARLTKLGLEEFEWLHSGGGQHPRRLHQQMSGKIYSLSDPPVIDEKTGERGIPGQLINCRCRMIPVIKFDDD